MLVQLQWPGFAQFIEHAHHSPRHGDVVGMAGNPLNILGEHYLWPNLPQYAGEGGVKIGALLRQIAIGKSEQMNIPDSQQSSRLSQLALPLGGQTLRPNVGGPDFPDFAARRRDQRHPDA